MSLALRHCGQGAGVLPWGDCSFPSVHGVIISTSGGKCAFFIKTECSERCYAPYFCICKVFLLHPMMHIAVDAICALNAFYEHCLLNSHGINRFKLIKQNNPLCPNRFSVLPPSMFNMKLNILNRNVPSLYCISVSQKLVQLNSCNISESCSFFCTVELCVICCHATPMSSAFHMVFYRGFFCCRLEV